MSDHPPVIHRTRSHHRLPHHPPPSSQLQGVPIPTSFQQQQQYTNSRSPTSPPHQHPTSPPITSSFRPPTRVRSSSSGTSSSASESDGDDVPLAQRIPTALRAQKTIRRQVRDEKDKRRAERARARTQNPDPVNGNGNLVSGMAGLGMTSSQEAAAMAAASSTIPCDDGKTIAPGQATSKPIARSGTRARARTLTGKDERPQLQPPMQVQIGVPFTGYQQQQSIPVAHYPQQHYPQQQHQGYQLQDQAPSRGRTIEDAQRKRSLSQHRRDPQPQPHTSPTSPTVPPIAAPNSTFAGITRAMTLSSRHGRSRPDPGQNTDFGPAPSTDSRAGRSLGRTNTTARARSQSRHHEQQHLNLPDPSSFPLPPQRPSIDPSPSADPRHSRVVLVEKKDHRYDAARKAFSSQENDGVEKLRIYMGDSETYNMVPHPTHRTNAKDIILTMQDAGMMKGWVGSGEWMLWEVWKELGVERPIRTFEVVGDVVGAWGKLGVTGVTANGGGGGVESNGNGAAKGNRLIAKISGLAPVLSRSALPSSAPMCSGYVDFEAKRGKWVKKWLMLRENAVYVAKRENAKEELLCSLSNFDAYIVTRAIKAPKPFTFALKSTDDLSFFEDKSDYMHLISCDEKTGGRWMERVLLARSFVLYQEKSTLFTASNGAAPTALSRSGTTSRKRAPTLLGSVLPSEPPIPPPMSHGHGHGHGVFEPGSLLGRQQAQRV